MAGVSFRDGKIDPCSPARFLEDQCLGIISTYSLPYVCVSIYLWVPGFILFLSPSWVMFGPQIHSASLKHHYQSQLHVGVCQLLFGLGSQLTMLLSSGFQPGFSLTAAQTALFHLALLLV